MLIKACLALIYQCRDRLDTLLSFIQPWLREASKHEVLVALHFLFPCLYTHKYTYGVFSGSMCVNFSFFKCISACFHHHTFIANEMLAIRVKNFVVFYENYKKFKAISKQNGMSSLGLDTLPVTAHSFSTN